MFADSVGHIKRNPKKIIKNSLTFPFRCDIIMMSTEIDRKEENIMKVTYETSLASFKAWGQARDILEEIDNADLMDEAEAYIEDVFGGEIDETELNDYLAYEWEDLYSAIGMPEDDEDEDEEEDYWDDEDCEEDEDEN